jgi:UDP-glucuronate decarboxylase
MIDFMNSPAEFVGPVNVGNPQEFTIRELAELSVSMVGSKSAISYKPLPQDDPKQRQPDITLAKAELGWAPKVELQDGLASTISYFKDKVL